jgi:acyl carrier protein
MDKAEVQSRVVKVTAKVLKVDPSQVTLTSDFAADLGAESIQSIELVAAFEEEFGIEMDEDAALQVMTVGAAVDFIYDNILKQKG